MAFLKVMVVTLFIMVAVQVQGKPSYGIEHFDHWLPGHDFGLAAPAPPFATGPLLHTGHAPFVHTPLLPAAVAPLPAPLPVPVPAPVPVPVPVPAPVPTYRAIPGPPITTHHVSVGYALPHSHPHPHPHPYPPPPIFSKVIAHHHVPHAHVHHHAAPSLHHFGFAKHAFF